jgi:hypothetical protein
MKSQKLAPMSSQKIVYGYGKPVKRTIEQLLAQKGGVLVESELPSHKLLLKALNTNVDHNHAQISKWKVKKACNYCSGPYTYNLLIGDINHGACNKARCVLASMRDHL